jgi:isopentenyl diphosphate isomerase/L-lactate dehydrogenase-like FMN-dependent dehydrogenase
VSVEEIGSAIRSPKLFQFYVHKDRGLTHHMVDRCKAAGGQPGVKRALGNLSAEIERDLKLMGARSLAGLSRENLRFR